MLNNNAVIQFLVQFHTTRDYFECHEILEEYWKTAPKDSFSELWVALIQVAVAQYHDRRNNIVGAKRMYESAIKKLQPYATRVKEIDLLQLIEDINDRLSEPDKPFSDINITIVSEQLKANCMDIAAKQQLQWGTSSRDVPLTIVDKHKLRDRSEIIMERERALKDKRNKH